MTHYILLEQGDWFEDEIRFMRGTIRPGDHVIDIGANYGVYTLSLAAKIGESGRVQAYEPCRATASHLRHSIGINALTNIELVEAAVSDRPGRGTLVLRDNTELNCLAAGDADSGEPVELVTLDESMERHAWSRMDFVKIDAEGHEISVIEGGKRSLDVHSPLVMCEIKTNGNDMTPIERLGEMGFAPYRLVPMLDALVPFTENEPLCNFQLNLFCCRQDRAECLSKRSRLVQTIDMPSPGKLDKLRDAGRELIGDFAYARVAWQEWDHLFTGACDDDYSCYIGALNSYAASRHPHATLTEKYGYLIHSFTELFAAVNRRETVPRLMSLARVASDIGWRGIAVRVLRRLKEIVENNESNYAKEPFLAVSREFERIDPSGNIHNWMVASVLDRLEMLRTHSTWFNWRETSGVVAALKQLGFCSQTMDRRADLVRKYVE